MLQAFTNVLYLISYFSNGNYGTKTVIDFFERQTGTDEDRFALDALLALAED